MRLTEMMKTIQDLKTEFCKWIETLTKTQVRLTRTERTNNPTRKLKRKADK